MLINFVSAMYECVKLTRRNLEAAPYSLYEILIVKLPETREYLLFLFTNNFKVTCNYSPMDR